MLMVIKLQSMEQSILMYQRQELQEQQVKLIKVGMQKLQQHQLIRQRKQHLIMWIVQQLRHLPEQQFLLVHSLLLS